MMSSDTVAAPALVTHPEHTSDPQIAKRRKVIHAEDAPADASRHIPSSMGGSELVGNSNDCYHEPLGDVNVVRGHPLGVKPLGNAYDSGNINLKSNCGTWSNVPDELIMLCLEYLTTRDLLQLGRTCRALYAFCHSDDLWKTLFVEAAQSGALKEFRWRSSWRSTLLNLPSDQRAVVSCKGLFSDVLFRPYHCATAPLESFADHIPSRNQIERLPDLTAEEYYETWADKPFILTEVVRKWPVFEHWSMKEFLGRYQETVFRAEAVDWPFSDYTEYMRNNQDESPLYLFDCRFAEKMGLSVGGENSYNLENMSDLPSYTPPECFKPDLFTCLGSARPDHRWLIIGPPRSGSTFHQDPNGTSAWNAVIRGGAKYWLMFPPAPAPLPPGIHVSSDSSEVTAPLSIMEYLLTFHAEARQQPGCIEAVCQPGEVLHVPAGWYHMVVNLEPKIELETERGLSADDRVCIALTQNFVSRRNLPNVLLFLRDKQDQVSGFRSSSRDAADSSHADEDETEPEAYNLFVERLRQTHPEDLETAMQEIQRRDKAKNNKSKWALLTGRSSAADSVARDNDKASPEAQNGPASGGFTFGFGLGASGDDWDRDSDSD